MQGLNEQKKINNRPSGRKLRVGVKFCGNCNPHIDPDQLLGEIQGILKDEAEFIPWFETRYDVLLVISACSVDCAKRPFFNGLTVCVAQNTVDGAAVEEKELPAAVARRIKKAEKNT